MSDVPSVRDTPLKQLYDVEYVNSLRADNDQLMLRIADLELMMRARLQRMPARVEDQSVLERTVEGLQRKIEDDDILHEERIKIFLTRMRDAEHEYRHAVNAADGHRNALWRILRSADKALGGENLIRKEERSEARSLKATISALKGQIKRLQSQLAASHEMVNLLHKKAEARERESSTLTTEPEQRE